MNGLGWLSQTKQHNPFASPLYSSLQKLGLTPSSDCSWLLPSLLRGTKSTWKLGSAPTDPKCGQSWADSVSLPPTQIRDPAGSCVSSWLGCRQPGPAGQDTEKGRQHENKEDCREKKEGENKKKKREKRKKENVYLNKVHKRERGKGKRKRRKGNVCGYQNK